MMTSATKENLVDTDSTPARPFQFGLNDIFALMLLFGIGAAVFAQHWMLPWQLLVLSAVCLASTVLVFATESKSNSGWPTGFVWFWLVGLFIFGPFMPVLMGLMVVVLASVFVKKIFLPRPTSVRTTAVIAATTILGVMLWTSMNRPYRLNSLLEARSEFPFVDLSNRLEYERTSPVTQVSTPPNFQSIQLSPEINERMSVREEHSEETNHYYSRTSALEKIHSASHEEFVRSIGFGSIRMPAVGSWAVRTPELQSIDFHQDVIPDDPDSEAIEWESHLRHHQHQESTDLASYHQHSENDFLHPATLGLQNGENETAGFISHAFHFPVSDIPKFRNDRSLWKLDHLQLVSLLKFEQPKVYIVDHLPRMDELSEVDFPTRELDEFETSALEQLRLDKDIVIDEQQDTVRMLGSLRAIENCTACHSVQRGELLGAFTYQFSRRKFK